jgi:type 1 glutamine amidotransferase
MFQKNIMKTHVTNSTFKLSLAVALCILFVYPALAIQEAHEKKKVKAHIVFLISEDPDNYEAHRTIPVFANRLRSDHNFKVTVLLGDGQREAYHFPGLDVLTEADLLVVFCRRVALSHQQLLIVKDYLKAGKPVIGLRTANHAFSVMTEVRDGYQAWPEFVSEILGCENRGYGPTDPGTDVAIVRDQQSHPILKGLSTTPQWHSAGNVYRVAPLLDDKAVVLLTGAVRDEVHPIAWTRMTADGSRVFYASLGYPDDFNMVPFRKLLVNSIYWALGQKP